MILVDSHEDLAWNILTFDRDYTRPAAETRRLEANSLTPQVNGDTLLGWPDYQRGQVGVVFGTLFTAPLRKKEGEWDNQVYANPEQANRLLHAQVDTYYRLVDEHADQFKLIQTRIDLQNVCQDWTQTERKDHPVGVVMLMEGAEGVRAPAEVEEWWAAGVRLIGPAWAGTRFCGGTNEPGPLTQEGYALLEAMAGPGFGLDLSHMDQEAALQALDAYPGQVMATHANALALLKDSDSNRHLPDRVMRGILERDGVIGLVPFNRFLRARWKRGDPRHEVSLKDLAAHIDYVCQMAGDAAHAGIGSDFDGGFGLQSTPVEVDTIADLRKIIPLLQEKGYSEADVAAILGENWLKRLQRILPESV